MPSINRLKTLFGKMIEGEATGAPAREILETYRCDASDLRAHARRFLRMVRAFEDTFPGISEVRLYRAPGRVNLIGEHTDYNGYPVLPMAIARDIAALVGRSASGSVQICNTESRYPPRAFEIQESLPPYGQGDWGNYVKAAIQGVVREGYVVGDLRGFRAVVDGTIPDSAGVSSSAALVVVSALAALGVNDVVVDPLELAEVLARAERYVGTEGGGMDQAISLLGVAGAALKIDFFPLHVEAVPFPEQYAIVVANSLVRASKSAGAREHYNRRVIECRLAAALGAQGLGARLGRKIETSLLSDLAPEKVGLPEDEVDLIIHRQLGEEPLALASVAERLSLSVGQVKEQYCRLRDGTLFGAPAAGLKLGQRYRHVVTEARRVRKAQKALRDGKIDCFGELMYESHTSCRDDYEVSCPELETLVSLARILRATGSRLTGAGFGGCTVSLVPREIAPAFAQKLWQGFSTSFPALARAEPHDPVFISRPAQGAGELFSSL